MAETTGLNEIAVEMKKIRKRDKIYTIMHITTLDPIIYRIVKEDTKQGKKNYTEEELKEIFEKCIKEVEEGKPCYILYDFTFFEGGVWKSVICLISYIPDTIKVNERFVYSSNALTIVQELDIPLHISFNKKSFMAYEEVCERCSKFRSK